MVRDLVGRARSEVEAELAMSPGSGTLVILSKPECLPDASPLEGAQVSDCAFRSAMALGAQIMRI
jgi:hypothetical protein